MKKRNINIAACLISIIMAASFTACTEGSNNETNNTGNTTETSITTADKTAEESGKPQESTGEENSKTPEESKKPQEDTKVGENKLSQEGKTPAKGEAEGDKPDKSEPDNDKTGDNNYTQNNHKPEKPVFSINPTPLTKEKGKGESIAKLAAEQAGIMYKFGGASPDKGFDNSGLIYYALTQNGIECPRLTYQIAETGSKIEYDQLQTGDLAFFEYEGDGIAHFGGVYLGEGKMAISMSDDIPVKIVDITTNYYKSTFVWGICVAR